MDIRITNPYPDPYRDRDTGKTCIGGGMHCPSASSLKIFLLKSADVNNFWYTECQININDFPFVHHTWKACHRTTLCNKNSFILSKICCLPEKSGRLWKEPVVMLYTNLNFRQVTSRYNGNPLELGNDSWLTTCQD